MDEITEEIASVEGLNDEYEEYRDDLLWDIQRLKSAVVKMTTARDEKVNGALTDLYKRLDVLKSQYKTVNGINRIVDFMKPYNKTPNILDAASICQDVITLINNMMIDLDSLIDRHISGDEVTEKLKKFCEKYYEHDFIDGVLNEIYSNASNKTLICMATYESAVIDVCQLVGPATQDIADFIDSANEEIANTQEQLTGYENELAQMDEEDGE